MAEYIEREALVATIEKRYCKPCEAEGKDYNHVRCRACWVDDMVGEIEDAPAADVAPVVHGRWEFAGGDDDEELYGWCSACNMHWKEEHIERFNYCPNCGAHMEDGDANA